MKKVLVNFFYGIKLLYEKHIMIFIALAAFIMNTAIECLGRRSIFDGFGYIFDRPFMFLYNALIIFLTMSVCLVFRRRAFGLTLISLVWLTCGIVNFVLLGFRITPFSAVDLQILSSVIGIIDVYLKGWQIVLLCVVSAAVVAGLVLLWLKAPKVKESIHYFTSAAVIASAFISVFVINGTSIAAETASTNYPNIADAYEDYGFAYCFSNSFIDQGINKPDEYGEVKMNEIRNLLDDKKENTEPDILPNIIMIQLESFFDVNYISGMEFSENPVPNFTELRDNYSSGFLTVPSIGAGTANTEFEILSGISLDFFGTSEYPYKTVLKDTPCESICYDLSRYGYKSHAIHNNDGTFYDRHKVFPNLGFDTFTSIEYMDNVSYNALGWADDSLLLKEITDAVSLTEARDFVYAISVQPHGKYPEDFPEDAPSDVKITSHSPEMTDEQKTAMEYYINQLHETDKLIKEITGYFSGHSEPSAVVFYGDHLPNLELDNEMLENGSLLDTEYVIWSNFDFDVRKVNLDAYRLSAYTMDRLGLNGGYVSTYNRYFSESGDYPDLMHYLSYDLLFGEKYIYRDELTGGNLYKPADMVMGLRKTYVENVSSINAEDEQYEINLSVKGNNFTAFSTVLINGKKTETVFKDKNSLYANDNGGLQEGDIISVAQIGDDNEILSISDEYEFNTN